MSTALTPRMRDRKWYAIVVGLLASIALCASTVTASAANPWPNKWVNVHSHLCMSVPGDKIYAGAVINQYPCGGYPDQWWFENQSFSNPGWEYIQPQQDNTLCVTYALASTAQLTLQYCGANGSLGNTITQLWYNTSDLELKTTQGWAMSVPGAAMGVAPINTYPYGPYPDQAWDPPFM